MLTSPLCRAKETADLAFGHSTTRLVLVAPGVTGTAADDARRNAQLRALVRKDPGSADTVMVTHGGNLGGAFGQSLEEGEVLVLRGSKPLGTVKPGDWARLKAAAG